MIESRQCKLIRMQLQYIFWKSLQLCEDDDTRPEGIYNLVWLRDMARGLAVDPELQPAGASVLALPTDMFEKKRGPLPHFVPVWYNPRDDSNHPLPPGLDTDTTGKWLNKTHLKGANGGSLQSSLWELTGKFGLSLFDAYLWLADRKFVSFDGTELAISDDEPGRFEAMVRCL